VINYGKGIVDIDMERAAINYGKGSFGMEKL
jgi:hypothetical protein